MSSQVADSLTTFQHDILNDIYGQEFISCSEIATGAMLELRQCEEDVVRIGLGDFGIRLKSFSEVVDLAHPHLKTFNVLHQPSLVSKRIHQFIETARFVTSAACDQVAKELPKMALRGISKDIKCLDNPIRTGQYVRLLASAEQRSVARSRKEVRTHSLDHMSRKNMDTWEATPSDFELYHRGTNNKLQEELQKAEDKKKRFRDLGLVSFGATIENSMREFKEQFSRSYYGFHKLTVTQAGLTLAKLHKCQYEARDGRSMRKIWWGKKEYAPHIYPLHALKDVPETMEKLVGFLEAYPGTNGKPVFDHYLVVMPGTIDGASNFHGKALENGSCSVLLGEVDGRCYFIAYYM